MKPVQLGSEVIQSIQPAQIEPVTALSMELLEAYCRFGQNRPFGTLTVRH